MKGKSLIFCFLTILGTCSLMAQVAADCSNAVPICNNTPVNGGTQGYGVDDFNGAARSGCLEQAITGTIESNSAWYRFRTSASGQLGFNIGFDASEDWDFALYRATDCSSLGDPVRCNFFDNSDAETFMGVGEDPTGNTTTVLYEDWLQVMPGEDYYLMINNYSNINSGFSIQFSGDIFITNPYDALDCAIINNLLGPPLAACDNENVILDATTTNALSYTWYSDTGSGFQIIAGETGPTLQVLVSAMYRVEVITTTMTNIISDVQVAFNASPITNPVSDEIVCSESAEFDLTQKDSQALGTQDPTAFMVTYHSSLNDAILGVNSLISPYPLSIGTESVYVRTTSLANPVCYDASEQFQLSVVATPVLSFATEVFICEDSAGVIIGETIPNSQYTYSWDTGESTPSITISQAGTYSLTVTNNQLGESCSATSIITVVVSETPEITDVIIDDLQNNNTVEIVTDVVGSFEYQLDNGVFQASNIFTNVPPGVHTVTINDLNGCGSVTETITVVGFPSFFTPNGDGTNDYWHILGVSNLEDPMVYVYDRYGKLLKQLDDSTLGWDGTFNGRELPSSDYWFKLTYTDIQGQRVEARYINNHFALKR
ncbi:T9SS type B sorting domain-containing protein [uncultured Eudoraea sp.]|uniref:T9SS type B sorting domain-containing protein n=1 Tax=uncultured Eudoraea sp. TaxID=1035614 RepID=UPI00263243BF|nr:T9SS type B sorting domain-containing protein [uncultured Eudoraea sp.]